MKKTILIFGGLSALLIVLFQINKLSVIGQQASRDVFIIASAIIFILVGVLITRLFLKPKQITDSEIDLKNLKKTGLSKREYEILKLVAKGQSNLEIADSLFISEHTVKSHISKILLKLNAKRRTHAIQIGKDLNIL